MAKASSASSVASKAVTPAKGNGFVCLTEGASLGLAAEDQGDDGAGHVLVDTG